MILLDLLVGLLAAFLFIGPILYAGFQLRLPPGTVPYPRAASIALVGLLASGVVDLLFGWLPIVGVLFAPAAWVYVVERYSEVGWPAALLLGSVSWALTVVMFAGVHAVW